MDFLLTSLSIKRIIYLVLVSGMALFFNNAVISAALMLALIPASDTFYRSILLLFMTGLIAAMLGFLAGCAAYEVWLLAIYLLIVTACAMFLSQRYPNYALPLFIINLIVLLSSEPALTLSDNLYRAIFILMGMCIAVVAHVVSWPYFTLSKLQACMVLSLRDLMQFNKEIFSCLLQPEYTDNVYLFERRLHLQKDKYIKSMQCLRHLIDQMDAYTSEDKKALLHDFFAKINLLYKIMLDYSQIRWRVTDHSTFAVCAPELEDIINEMNKMFSEAITLLSRKKYHLHTSRLTDKIMKLDDNYHSVLQVAAREPLVFLLFLSSLKAWDEEAGNLRKTELEVRLKFLWHT